jgi:hypothetical protein
VTANRSRSSNHSRTFRSRQSGEPNAARMKDRRNRKVINVASATSIGSAEVHRRDEDLRGRRACHSGEFKPPLPQVLIRRIYMRFL